MINLQSSLSRKFFMGVTGFLLCGFILTHMAGNLLAFLGPQAYNDYAAGLESLGPLLWIARIGLLLFFTLHIYNAIQLKRQNSSARPQAYVHPNTVQASFSSRHMVLTGLMILAFVLFHLSHFTLGIIDPAGHALVTANGHHDVYAMVVGSFQNPLIALLYIFAMAILALHLHHGASSLFQSLGFSSAKHHCWVSKVGPTFAIITFVGYCSLPIATLLGVLKI